MEIDKILTGSASKAVCDTPIFICNAIRLQFDTCNLGEQWPFIYNSKKNELTLVTSKIPKADNIKIQQLFFCRGYCVLDSKNIEKNDTAMNSLLISCMRGK